MPETTSPLKPSRTYGYLSLAFVAVAAVIALTAAWGALVAIERSSKSAVEHALYLSGEEWAEVETNGLQVILSGKAPSEAARFAALSAAGHEVDGARVIDKMVLPEAVAIVPPRFSIEMLRGQAGISLIGLIPDDTDRERLFDRMRAIDPLQPVADFLETAQHPTPEGWEEAVDYLLYATELLPQSKISMDAGRLIVEGIAGSPDEKAAWEQAIRRQRPAGLRLSLDIRSPHQVVSPFIMRFIADEQGTRFDACTAHNENGRRSIIGAGVAAGVTGSVDCQIGLGVPSPDWADAVARGIRAVSDLGGGTLTFSDADITLIAPEDTAQDVFDRVTGELEADLPEVFSLHSVRPVSETGPVSPAGPPEFIASLTDSGTVQLRGRVASEQDRTVVESLARARFGSADVYAPLRLDPSLPASWAIRTLAGLEALDQLANGRVVVQPDVVTVTGTTGARTASAEISRLLSEQLGEAEDFRVNVKYEEALDPVAAMPTPQECVADINAVLAKAKIAFAPGAAEIERASLETVDRIAEIVKTCPDVAMEIGGYTDSQGREEMNQALSQRRAEAVVSALLARRVLTTNLQAFGYGEDFPISDNETEDGREANRRIEFRLVGETRAGVAAPSDGGAVPNIRPPSRPEGLGEAEAESEGTETGDPAAGDGQAPEIEAEAPAEQGAPETGGDDTASDEAAAADAGEAPESDAAMSQDTGAPETTPEPAISGGATEPVEDTEAETQLAGAAPDETALTSPDAVAGSGETEAVTDVAADAESDAQGARGAQDDPIPEAEATAAPEPAEDAPQDSAVAAEETGAPEAGDPVTLEASAAPVAEEAAEEAAPSPGTADPPTTDTAPDAAEDPVETTDVLPSDAARPGATASEEAGSDDAFEPVEDEGAETGVSVTDPPGDAAPSGPDTNEETVPDPQSAATEAPGEGGLEDIVTDADVEAEASTEGGPAAAPEAEVPAITGAPVADPDMPNTRPRARPPLVVHPDLEGVRPRPRPADIPDAPSTE